ncbi:hypothetical protein KI387_044174 [Taxus chinensis]|uniref:Uncharacterized protein n=1 Tax=Taxus chinensis TaxID=29808 RepID=A0AA38BX81_TAXCH|nr:hypothetical protein KI387_044174 [Taxus chinensis]
MDAHFGRFGRIFPVQNWDFWDKGMHRTRKADAADNKEEKSTFDPWNFKRPYLFTPSSDFHKIGPFWNEHDVLYATKNHEKWLSPCPRNSRVSWDIWARQLGHLGANRPKGRQAALRSIWDIRAKGTHGTRKSELAES